MKNKKIFYGVLAIVVLIMTIGCLLVLNNSINKPSFPCGGWGTFGDVVCECSGKLERQKCPANVICDGGTDICHGSCGKCKCYQGPAKDGFEIPCNGRDKQFKAIYCVDYLGNPDPEGPCSTVGLEARKCKNINDCHATCAFGCVNKNWDMRGRSDCEAIPQYECKCIYDFCQVVDGRTQTEHENCGIENCHGLDITCGPNIPDGCTMEMRLDDFCRQYVRCEKIDRECRLIKDPKFEECKSCIEQCNRKEDPEKAFQCASKCME